MASTGQDDSVSQVSEFGELDPSNRLLMGPGPSEVHPRVLRSMSTGLVSHLDPAFIDIMDEVQDLLRYTFQTDNKWTIPVSGTGSAAMETAIGNLVEPGDTMLVPTNGYFGDRMEKMAKRAGGDVVHVDAPWGEPLDPDDVREAFAEHQPEIFGFVHAETSTGVLQPDVPELTRIAREHDAYVVADTVTSLGGVELRVDEWDIDVAYSAAQKCLSCPPGASPLTVNDRAMDKVFSREEPNGSWYLDLSALEAYWGSERSYHHTAPITNIYALREALRLIEQEGLEERWDRHTRVARGLNDGLEEIGLETIQGEEYWLPTLNAVHLPDGVDDQSIVQHLLENYDLTISRGLGALEGDILRIGCMGYGAKEKNIEYVLTALQSALASQRE